MTDKEPKELMFSLTIEDIQCVADQVFGRELTESELETLKNKLCSHIPWFDCVTEAIDTEIIR
jgi:hypothetical protein